VQAAAPRESPAGNRAGALVVGGDYQGLGIVRSLGRNRVPVGVVDDEHSIARFSRYATFSHSVPDLRNEGRAMDALMEIGRRRKLDGCVLYPTRDEAVAAFSRNRSRLAQYFRVPTPGWETIKWVWDKRNTYKLANDLGIPTPRTWYPGTSAELGEIRGAPPFAVKPAIKDRFFYATKAKAWRANSAEELGSLFEKAAGYLDSGQVMIQDLIPGGGSQQFAYCAFFKDGNAVSSMVVRRARQHPAEFGRASTYVETVDAPEIEEYSLRFLRAIDYYGLVEIEFKLDPRDGRYRLLDVNGRTWGYHSLGARAGVDFAHQLYRDQMGEKVQGARGRTGVGWIRLVTDIPMEALAIAGGRRNPFGYMGSVLGADTEAVFSLGDPLPGLAELLLLPYLFLKRGF
jgi:predicted ATP-grasp superfamily ATP-dependent carboligase